MWVFLWVCVPGGGNGWHEFINAVALVPGCSICSIDNICRFGDGARESPPGGGGLDGGIVNRLFNNLFFAVDDVDAGRQGVHIGGIVCHLDAVKVVNGLIGYVRS